MLDAGRGEATSDEVAADAEGKPKGEELPKVTEPAMEERTKPDGIKLWDKERSEAAEVVPNKPPVLEAVHADT